MVPLLMVLRRPRHPGSLNTFLVLGRIVAIEAFISVRATDLPPRTS